VWLRRLSTDRIERRLAAPDDVARVLVAPVRSALRIVALNDAAARLGLRNHMALADARATHPNITVMEADAEADGRLLGAVADWCDRYTPLVGLDPPDGLALDITGCAHLFGGETALARDLVHRLTRQGLQARVAAADTFGCAWGMARYGTPGIVPRGRTEAALLPLPIAALRIEPEIVAGLKRIGLVRIGDLHARPRAPLTARFGAGLIRQLDRALGLEDESIRPRLPVPEAVAEQRFAEPIAREDDVLASIGLLARQLDRVLERRGEGARLIQLALFRADGTIHRIEIGTGLPLRDPQRVQRLFQDRLAVLGDACDPGFGFDLVRLSVLAGERMEPIQIGLAAPDHAEELVHLIDRLGTRFGPQRICRLVPQNTHIPELAVAAVPAHRAPKNAPGALAIEQDSLAALRPIRLFERPEPIEAIDEVPDGPPVRFRWRRVWHHVIAAEGPERIAPEWWQNRPGDLVRDYFRIENDRGVRFWLYRNGLYQPDKPKPRWYLHGLFA
jgi:protein ImuB